ERARRIEEGLVGGGAFADIAVEVEAARTVQRVGDVQMTLAGGAGVIGGARTDSAATDVRFADKILGAILDANLCARLHAGVHRALERIAADGKVEARRLRLRADDER